MFPVFKNLKSHFVFCVRSFKVCKVVSVNWYDISLRDHIEIVAIEKVDIPEDMEVYERLKKCEVRENYWKDKLRTWSCFGGLNTRK